VRRGTGAEGLGFLGFRVKDFLADRHAYHADCRTHRPSAGPDGGQAAQRRQSQQIYRSCTAVPLCVTRGHAPRDGGGGHKPVSLRGRERGGPVRPSPTSLTIHVSTTAEKREPQRGVAGVRADGCCSPPSHRHVIGHGLTHATRVHIASDEVASNSNIPYPAVSGVKWIAYVKWHRIL
jgi:hypothetical protein